MYTPMWVRGAVVVACVLFVPGMLFPVLWLDRMKLWTDTYSLAGVVYGLFARNQHILAGAVALFGIGLPLCKLAWLYLATCPPRVGAHTRAAWVTAFDTLGSWAMHDVLVVALAVMLIKQPDARDHSLVVGVSLLGTVTLCMWAAQAYMHWHQPRTRHVPRYTMWHSVLLWASVWAAGFTLWHGVHETIVRFTTVYVFTDEYSVVSLTYTLYEKKSWFLFWVLFLFSFVVPVAKVLILATLALHPPRLYSARVIHALEWFGRFSMVDIMVLALLVFYVGTSGYIEPQVHVGAHYFCFSVVCTMVGYACVLRRAHAYHHERADAEKEATGKPEESMLSRAAVRRMYLGAHLRFPVLLPLTTFALLVACGAGLGYNEAIVKVRETRERAYLVKVLGNRLDQIYVLKRMWNSGADALLRCQAEAATIALRNRQRHGIEPILTESSLTTTMVQGLEEMMTKVHLDNRMQIIRDGVEAVYATGSYSRTCPWKPAFEGAGISTSNNYRSTQLRTSGGGTYMGSVGNMDLYRDEVGKK